MGMSDLYSFCSLSHSRRWHADIKPDNILWVQQRFKLADPGFARFERANEKDETIIRGGTRTYGMSEVYL
jgi:hypothetical protein